MTTTILADGVPDMREPANRETYLGTLGTADAEILAARVRKGAALLDRVEPGWWRRIALDWLAMASCDRCILGQLHGDYVSGFRRVLDTLPASQSYSGAAHGFTLFEREQRISWKPNVHDPESFDMVCEPGVMARFATLADLWRLEVRARLDQPSAGVIGAASGPVGSSAR